VKDAIQQFRITAWPGLLPHPTVGNPLPWGLSEDGVLAAVGVPVRVVDVPDLELEPLVRAEAADLAFAKGDADDISAVGEIYLELIDLDLEDEAAIFRFVSRFGVLGVAHDHFSLFRSLPGFATAILPALAAAWPAERYNQRVENYLERRGDGLNTNLVETLEEFRFGTRVLRDLVTATRISQLDEPPVAVRWESIPEEAMNEKRADLAGYDMEFDAQEEAVQIFLRQVLTDGLRPFHPRVIVDAEATDEFRAAPLYAVCCLELFNHMVEAAQVSVCANDSCRRPFVRQRGRAEHGQYRVRGVKYCSSHCARAQAQRVYRRRLKASSRNTDLS
jgi:hypothetical protein